MVTDGVVDVCGYVCMYCGSRQSTSTPGRVRCAVCGRDTFGGFQARANALWRDGLKAQLQHDAQQSESASSPAVEVAGPSAATAAEPDSVPVDDAGSFWSLHYRGADDHVWVQLSNERIGQALGDAVSLLLRGLAVKMVREP